MKIYVQDLRNFHKKNIVRYTVKCANFVNFGARKNIPFFNRSEFWTTFLEVESGASQPLKTKPIPALRRDLGWQKHKV